MLDLSAEAAALLTGSFVMHTRVESWMGEELLSSEIPVTSGTEDVDRSLRVPERVSFTVPREDRGFSWDPKSDPDHPLAAFGQRLRVLIGIELSGGVIEWLQRGWFLIRETSLDGDSVSVEAVGLLALVDEAKFVSPYQPSGTFVTTLRGLVEPALTVDVDEAPTDRAVPGNMAWDEDRLGAVMELLDAWPADAIVTPDGNLTVTADVDPTVPVLSLTDGLGGTVVQWGGASSRDGAATVVVARGQASDGAQVQGVVEDLKTTSPLRSGGPFNPLPVPYFYFSPLLTTNAECRASARTILRRLRRTADRMVSAVAVPNPALVAGDLVTVTGVGLVNQPCLVEALQMPLTPSSGPMTLTLRVVD